LPWLHNLNPRKKPRAHKKQGKGKNQGKIMDRDWLTLTHGDGDEQNVQVYNEEVWSTELATKLKP